MNKVAKRITVQNTKKKAIKIIREGREGDCLLMYRPGFELGAQMSDIRTEGKGRKKRKCWVRKPCSRRKRRQLLLLYPSGTISLISGFFGLPERHPAPSCPAPMMLRKAQPTATANFQVDRESEPTFQCTQKGGGGRDAFERTPRVRRRELNVSPEKMKGDCVSLPVQTLLGTR